MSLNVEGASLCRWPRQVQRNDRKQPIKWKRKKMKGITNLPTTTTTTTTTTTITTTW
jgi:hypothetical protein